MLQGKCKFEVSEKQLVIYAEPHTDYFVSPVDGSVTANAALVYEEVTGDFVCRAKVSLEHKSMFDAGVLMAVQDDTHWAKACFELGDYGFKSVCAVMTNGLSDDCNGATVEENELWLQLARTGNVFSVHYSMDGENYFLTRLCSLPFAETLKVGFEAQSPTGEGGKRCFTDYVIEHHGLEDPRLGI